MKFLLRDFFLYDLVISRFTGYLFALSIVALVIKGSDGSLGVTDSVNLGLGLLFQHGIRF